MKLRKRKLFSSMAFVLSLVMLAVSGAIFVHTATQQNATSTLQVTYDARNVNFTADAWYQKPSNNARQAFTGNTLSVSATAAESSSHTLSVGSEITLDATTDTYILFTYKFVNTASSGGYDMLVALTDNATKTNVNVKYYTSVISGTNPSMYSTLSSQKDTVENGGSSSVPAAVCVPAQSTLYYYVLVEIDDPTLGSSYVGDSTHKITWSVTSANTKGATMYSVCFDANGGSGSMASQSYTSGTQQALRDNEFTNGAKTFAGWSTTPNGSVVYANEQALTLTSQSNGAQIVLYAKWEEVTAAYSITYAGMDGATFGTYHPTSIPEFEDYWFNVSNPTKEGYVFTGWNITGMDDNTAHTIVDEFGIWGGTSETSFSGAKGTRFKNLRATSGIVIFTATWRELVNHTITIVLETRYHDGYPRTQIYTCKEAFVDYHVTTVGDELIYSSDLFDFSYEFTTTSDKICIYLGRLDDGSIKVLDSINTDGGVSEFTPTYHDYGGSYQNRYFTITGDGTITINMETWND